MTRSPHGANGWWRLRRKATVPLMRWSRAGRGTPIFRRSAAISAAPNSCTGAPARPGRTLLLRDGRIAGEFASDSTEPPAGAEVLDLQGGG